MKVAFKTKDNLTCVKDCPDVDEVANVIMSPLWRNPPTPDGKQDKNFQEWRKYERTGEIHEACPVFLEA